MTFGTIEKKKIWFTLMEILIQITLWGRIGIILLKYDKDAGDKETVLIITNTVYFVITEILPFAFLVYGMLMRLKSHLAQAAK